MKLVVAFCLLTAVTVGQPEMQIRSAAVEKEGTGSVVVGIQRPGVNGLTAVTVTVTPMTYGEFSAMSNAVSLPRALPDPAECKLIIGSSNQVLHMYTISIFTQLVICHTTASISSSVFS